MPLIYGSQLEIPFILATGSSQLLLVDSNGVSGSFVGSLSGTASNAISASYATTASYVIGGGGGVLQYPSSTLFPPTGSVTTLYVDDSTKLSYYYSGSGYVGVGIFNNDIVVSLSGGKTVGRYASGSTIPARGKTPESVFNLIAQEPINPTVALTSPTTILYNQPTTTNAITASYTINSLGATIVSASLYWRYNNTGTYTLLTSSTATPLYYSHALTLGANNATSSINYLYAITESSPTSASTTLNITPAGYVNPTVTVTPSYISILSGETNTIREYGNVSSSIVTTVKGNNTYSDLSSYQLQISTNGGSTWSYLTGSNLPSGTGTNTINYTDYSAPLTAASIIYRAAVTGSNGTVNTTNSSTISFRYRSYFAASPTVVNSNTTAQSVINSGTILSLLSSSVFPWTLPCTSANQNTSNYTYILYPFSFGAITTPHAILLGAVDVTGTFSTGSYAVSSSYGTPNINMYVYQSSQPGAYQSTQTLQIN